MYCEKQKEKRKLIMIELNNFIDKRKASAFNVLEDSEDLELGKEMKLYEILIANVLKYLDMVLLISLFVTGTNRVDIFHIVLLIYLTLFVVYPSFMRRNFVYFVISVTFVLFFKYIYVLIAKDIASSKTVYKTLFILGLVTEFDDDNKFWKSALLNDNWLVFLLAMIQYQLYKSKLLGSIFLEKKKIEERIILFVKYPNLSKIFIYVSTVIATIVPWLIYATLLILSMVLDKTIINLQFTGFTIIFICVHSLKSLVSWHSNVLIARIWSVFIVFSAISFLGILSFQLLQMKILEDDLQIFEKLVPKFVKENIHIIGLENYSELETIQLALKLLPFVLNFSLGVYARRLMLTNSEKIKSLDNSLDEIRSSIINKPIIQSESFDEIVFGTRFSMSFLMYKFRNYWWFFDGVWHYSFYTVFIMIFMLSVYWQISIAMLINITLISFYFFKIGRNLQPVSTISHIKVESDQTIIELDDAMYIRSLELSKTNSVILNFRTRYTKFLIIFNSLCYCLLYISSFCDKLISIYPSIGPVMNNVIFFANYAGIYYSENTEIHAFSYQAMGYVMILAMLAVERRSQVWLSTKIGLTEGVSKYFEAVEKNQTENRQRAIRWFEAQYGVEVVEETEKSELIIEEKIEKKEEKEEEKKKEKEEKKKEEKEEEEDKSLDSDSYEGEDDSFDSGGSDNEFDIYKTDYKSFVSRKINAEKEKKVRSILNIKYIYSFLRLLKTVIFLLLILITVVGISFKGNLYSILSLIALVPLIFRRMSYKAIKEFNWFLLILSILEYWVALSNLSSENSPMSFPVPFNHTKLPYQPPPIPIPWYTKFSYFQDYPDWAYFIGWAETERARSSIWFEWSWIIICSVYFSIFNSIVMDKNMQLTMRDSIIKIFKSSEEHAQDKILKEAKDESSLVYRQVQSTINEQFVPMNKNDQIDEKMVEEYMQNQKKTMLLRLINNIIIDILWSVSSVLSLLSLLLMSFDSSGIINLFYVIFCLTFLYQTKNFITQKDWKFPYYLQKLLKPFVYFEICLQILYQTPIVSMHNSENSKNSWQQILGVFRLWTYENNQIHSTEHQDDLLIKSLMLVFIIMQENIFNSIDFKHFLQSKLWRIVEVSSTKANCLAYIYNNK
jgi:hypothetical protein